MNTKNEEALHKNIPDTIIQNISKELLTLLQLPKYSGFYLEKVTASEKEANVSLQKKTLKI